MKININELDPNELISLIELQEHTNKILLNEIVGVVAGLIAGTVSGVASGILRPVLGPAALIWSIGSGDIDLLAQAALPKNAFDKYKKRKRRNAEEAALALASEMNRSAWNDWFGNFKSAYEKYMTDALEEARSKLMPISSVMGSLKKATIMIEKATFLATALKELGHAPWAVNDLKKWVKKEKKDFDTNEIYLKSPAGENFNQDKYDEGGVLHSIKVNYYEAWHIDAKEIRTPNEYNSVKRKLLYLSGFVCTPTPPPKAWPCEPRVDYVKLSLGKARASHDKKHKKVMDLMGKEAAEKRPSEEELERARKRIKSKGKDTKDTKDAKKKKSKPQWVSVDELEESDGSFFDKGLGNVHIKRAVKFSWDKLLKDTGVSLDFWSGMIAKESSLDPTAKGPGSDPALGLFQLRGRAQSYLKGKDWKNPYYNALAAAENLKKMLPDLKKKAREASLGDRADISLLTWLTHNMGSGGAGDLFTTMTWLFRAHKNFDSTLRQFFDRSFPPPDARGSARRGSPRDFQIYVERIKDKIKKAGIRSVMNNPTDKNRYLGKHMWSPVNLLEYQERLAKGIAESKIDLDDIDLGDIKGGIEEVKVRIREDEEEETTEEEEVGAVAAAETEEEEEDEEFSWDD